MAVRQARFADIPAIVLILHEAYPASHYARTGSAKIDDAEAKRLLVNSIQRNGSTNGGGCFVAVAEKEGAVEGFILGTLTRVYSIFDKLSATDLFWLGSPRCDPRDAIQLMKGMIEWAKSSPHLVEIKCGTTAIMDDPERAGRILERLGMEPYGKIFRMEVAR